jgi:hypothetical protein
MQCNVACEKFTELSEEYSYTPAISGLKSNSSNRQALVKLVLDYTVSHPRTRLCNYHYNNLIFNIEISVSHYFNLHQTDQLCWNLSCSPCEVAMQTKMQM